MTKYRRYASILALVLSSVLLSHCSGYQLGNQKPFILGEVERIAVPTFKNNTLEQRIAVGPITNTVIQELQNDGTFKIGNRDNADAILEGTITEIRRRQQRSARFNSLRTRELEITVYVDYILRDPSTDVILQSGTVSGQSDVFLDSNFQLSEREAIPLAAEKLARRLVTNITEGW